VSEEGIHRRAKLVRRPGIGPTCVGRGTGPRPEERAVDLRPALGKARGVQKTVLVEHPDDLLDVRPGDSFALVSATEVGLDVADRVLAIEERDHVEQRLGQEQDRFRVAGRISEGDEALPVLTHRKRLDTSELRGVHRLSRNFSAATV